MKRQHVPIGLALAIAISGTPLTAYGVICYVQTWFNVKQFCTGGCSGIYDNCPGTVLCSNVPTDSNTRVRL